VQQRGYLIKQQVDGREESLVVRAAKVIVSKALEEAG